jgi:hypothetical protein
MNKKIILDLCGGTGAWSKPYKEAGFEVINVTLPEFDVTSWGGYLDLVNVINSGNVYGIFAAPPCTQFSFARTKAKKPRDLWEGMGVVKACLDIIWTCQRKIKSDQQKLSPLKFWALENPYWGMLRWFMGKPAFDFNPYDFGDRYQKHTALWGNFNEPKKNPIQLTKEEKYKFGRHSQSVPELPEGYKWGDLNKRAAARAITPPKFAQAFYEANK